MMVDPRSSYAMRWLPAQHSQPVTPGDYRALVMLPPCGCGNGARTVFVKMSWDGRGWLAPHELPPGGRVVGWAPNVSPTHDSTVMMVDDDGNIQTFTPIPPVTPEILAELTETL